jgi:diaminopimelate epimerase
MTGRAFIKMHGLGNDFVVIDARRQPLTLTDAQASAVADRKTGVGCDQFIVIEPPNNGTTDAAMRIRNADGGEVEACGNASRCVAQLLMRKRVSNWSPSTPRPDIRQDAGGGRVAVDLGPAGWREILLARD